MTLQRQNKDVIQDYIREAVTNSPFGQILCKPFFTRMNRNQYILQRGSFLCLRWIYDQAQSTIRNFCLTIAWFVNIQMKSQNWWINVLQRIDINPSVYFCFACGNHAAKVLLRIDKEFLFKNFGKTYISHGGIAGCFCYYRERHFQQNSRNRSTIRSCSPSFKQLAVSTQLGPDIGV